MQEPIKATAYCLIEKAGKVLLTKDENKSGWKLPGGEVEKNEFIIDAARREVKEETGFEVDATGIVSIQEYLKESGEHRLRFYFTAQLRGGEEKLMVGEVKEIKWMDRAKLSKMTESDFYIPPYYLAIQEYLANKNWPLSILNRYEKTS